MTPCLATPGCTGSVEDGYCDTCGMKAVSAPASVSASAPALANGSPCSATPGCAGHLEDGYCDTCGMKPVLANTASTTSARTSSARTSSRRTTSTITARTSTSSTRTASSRRRYGAGLVEITPITTKNPADAVMKNPEVVEDKRFCASCGEAVGRSRPGVPARTEGFCRNCGARFSFAPKLQKGDLVNAQYLVQGCLAHGGLGWIYLATDQNVSGRWVVLKGLLDSADADAAAAAQAERQFLAEVEHPNIVKIYNFVWHDSEANGR